MLGHRVLVALALFAAAPGCGSSGDGDLYGPHSGGSAGTAGAGASSGASGAAGSGSGGVGAVGAAGGTGGATMDASTDGSGGATDGAGGAGASTADGAAGAAGSTDGAVDACSQKTTFYADSDGDGYGDAAKSLEACSAPSGYASNADDCFDDNAYAKPGQLDYFQTDRGDGSYDYDCDGNGAKHWQGVGNCGFAICVLTAGWQQSEPACGVDGKYITGCAALAICGAKTETRKQECH